ncbi:hypothetical protein [Phytopseudomonas punonensis]|uniref:Uncharacterized protein n=1 Tax=Phytopseudomonas punonensis TaxID=1220495 RepID=A0A1M7D548_9GAMM|nr:hypothetical protein [Pseudomonas punonensis]SHL74527.1 hypothetical protein SAMN05216288_2350 [Pseudomonas punonensis]
MIGTTIFCAAQRHMPAVTKWLGWAGLLLGPVLGVMHVTAMLLMPTAYGRPALEQYDVLQRTGNLLAAPLAQYLITIGFALCLLWFSVWGLRLVLIAYSRLAGRFK